MTLHSERKSVVHVNAVRVFVERRWAVVSEEEEINSGFLEASRPVSGQSRGCCLSWQLLRRPPQPSSQGVGGSGGLIGCRTSARERKKKKGQPEPDGVEDSQACQWKLSHLSSSKNPPHLLPFLVVILPRPPPPPPQTPTSPECGRGSYIGQRVG